MYIGNQPSQIAFVTDSFNGTGSQTVFTMSVAPANTASVLIAITGVLQDPSTYSVSGTTLTFSAAPPSGTANISARYLGIPASGITTTAYRTVTEFTASAGQTVFTPPSYTVGFINVYRNGVRLGSADYTATNGTTVTLAYAATLNDLIAIESFYVSSILNGIPNTAGSVQQTNIATGVGGTGPAFSASRTGSDQTISAGTWTKVQFNTETFDTNNNFDSTTNYRFTPTVAGYYQLNSIILLGGSGINGYIQLYKNGSGYQYGNSTPTGGGASGQLLQVSAVAYANGTSDYFEIYGFSGGTNIQGGLNISAFTGCLVRAG